MVLFTAVYLFLVSAAARILPWSPARTLQIRYAGSDWITPGMELDIQGMPSTGP